MHKREGFTLVELLVVMAVIGILAAIAIPGLLRARQSGNESSAVGSLRAITAGQSAYASTCARGGYAQNNVDLTKGPPGGVPFVGVDLEKTDVVEHAKSGYVIDVNDNAHATNRDVTPAADTCNGSTASARLNFFVAADPVIRGETGGRSFASDRSGTIYFDLAAPIANPVPGAAEFIQ